MARNAEALLETENSIMTDATFLASNLNPLSLDMTTLLYSGGNFSSCLCRHLRMLFAASAGLTIVWCASMSGMGGMPMPGGWTMSMMWMRMPGQTWIERTASFLAMWVVMMAAMMLPSLRRCCGATVRRFADGESRLGLLTLIAVLAISSFGPCSDWRCFRWACAGTLEMEHPVLARAVPVIGRCVIFIAGAVQFTSWKARHLARCRETPARGCRATERR